MQSQLSPAELAYQEDLIHERETEIREIETGIHELSEIFRDLGTLVTEQGGMIGAYHYPIRSIHTLVTFSDMDYLVFDGRWCFTICLGKR